VLLGTPMGMTPQQWRITTRHVLLDKLDSSSCRLVFHCLLELCRCQAKGIVEHAVLLGTPVGMTPQRWRMARTVVAGRLVNGYSSQDWVCALHADNGGLSQCCI
jgi:hypothetical protein